MGRVARCVTSAMDAGLPYFAGALYICVCLVIPLYVWLPWMWLHNQLEFDGYNRWLPAVGLLWALAAYTLVLMHRVVTTDPGAVPLMWTGKSKSKGMGKAVAGEGVGEGGTEPGTGVGKRCGRCDSGKPPRTHHCSTCRRCVVGMDHHCVWLGVCVGAHNRKPFIQFLSWLLVGLMYVLALTGLRMYPWYVLRYYHYDEAPAWHREMDYRIMRIQIPLSETVWLAVSVIVLPMVAVALAWLLLLQLRNAARGMTQIESWHVAAAAAAAAAAAHPSGQPSPVPYFPYAAPSRLANLAVVLGPNPLAYMFTSSSSSSGYPWLAPPVYPPPTARHVNMYDM